MAVAYLLCVLASIVALAVVTRPRPANPAPRRPTATDPRLTLAAAVDRLAARLP